MVDIRKPEAFHALADLVLAGADRANPWSVGGSGRLAFTPDYATAKRLISIPVCQGKKSNSGLFARAVDLWTAHELRRGGFSEDEVWPRAVQPRVLSQDLVELERAVRERPDFKAPGWLKRKLKGSAKSTLLGGYYTKEVDVVVARWERGAEVMISGRSMLSSYWNNLRNRSEDLLGDADNLRHRYPQAAIGLIYVVGSSIKQEAGAFEFTCDMLRRLREPRLYDATGLMVVEWDDSEFGSWSGERQDEDLADLAVQRPVVKIFADEVPENLAMPQFFKTIIDTVLERTPVDHHETVRELRTAGRTAPEDQD